MFCEWLANEKAKHLSLDFRLSNRQETTFNININITDDTQLVTLYIYNASNVIALSKYLTEV